MTRAPLSIGNRKLDRSNPPYLVAEVSANHGGSLQKAIDTIGKASEMGADAVKIQTYTPDTLTIDCDKPDFLVTSGAWKGRRLYDLYQQAQTPYEWHEELFAFAKKEGITLFSTPFDETAVDLLEQLKVPAYKIASFEMLDFPLLERVCSTHKPIIISTGLASLEEIQQVNDFLTTKPDTSWLFLYCVSGYPTPLNQANILTLADMAQQLNAQVGLSDHSLGFDAAVAATALGTVLIEKHFILDRNDGGPDAAFSMEPLQWQQLVERCQATWSALGQARYDLKEAEQPQRQFRRSIYAVKAMRKGDVFSKNNIRCIRPGYGLPPRDYPRILGLTAAQDIAFGDALTANMIDHFSTE